MRKKSFQSLNHLQPGVIIVSDSDSDNESKKRTKKPVSSTSNYQNDRIEIDLTADDSPPLVTTSRGTPLITTAKKSQKFAENHSFIDYYFPTNSTSPVLGTRHKRKIEEATESSEAKRVRNAPSLHPQSTTTKAQIESQLNQDKINSSREFETLITYAKGTKKPPKLVVDQQVKTKSQPPPTIKESPKSIIGVHAPPSASTRSLTASQKVPKADSSRLNLSGHSMAATPPPSTPNLRHIVWTTSTEDTLNSVSSTPLVPLSSPFQLSSFSLSEYSPTSLPIPPSCPSGIGSKNRKISKPRTPSTGGISDGDRVSSLEKIVPANVGKQTLKKKKLVSKPKRKNLSPKSSSFEDYSSSSNHSTCSLSHLSANSESHPTSLFTELLSHLPSTSTHKGKVMIPLDLDYVLKLILKETGNHPSDFGSGYQALEKFLYKESIKKSTPIPIAQEFILDAPASDTLPSLDVSSSSALSHGFDLGDCSRLIGESQSLILRNSSLPSQFVDMILGKVSQLPDGEDEESWYRSKQESLGCLIEYFHSPAGKTVLCNWKPSLAQIRNYAKLAFEKQSIRQDSSSLHLRGLELMCDQYLRILSIQLLEDSRPKSQEILLELGALLKSTSLLNLQVSSISLLSTKGNHIIHLLGKILLLILKIELKSQTYESGASDQKILEVTSSTLTPLIKALGLTSDEMKKLISSADYFTLGPLLRLPQIVPVKKTSSGKKK